MGHGHARQNTLPVKALEQTVQLTLVPRFSFRVRLAAGPRGEYVGLALGGDIAVNPQAMTLEQIREQGLAVLRKHLGIVGMVRFLQQAEMGSGNYTEERYQWLGDPDLEELAKKIQAHYPDRANLT